MKLNLPAPFVGTHHTSVGSTMDVVARETYTADLWPFILADEQTAGRGRRGRNWRSGAGGNYYASFMLPLKQGTDANTIGLLAGLAAQQALVELAPAAAFQLKWPNDIVTQDADGNWGKFGGILLETKGVGTPDFRAIIGMGLNLAHAPEVLANPNPHLPRALCGQDIGVILTPATAANAFCTAFLPLFNTWQTQGFAPLVAPYNAVLWRINQDISVSTTQDKSDAQHGINRGVDSSGALQLETPSGIESITVGEL